MLDHETSQLIGKLVIMIIFGGITAWIADSKGRNPVGWFFIGFIVTCIGLIIILCLSDLKEEEVRWQHAQDEQRRLREQLKQERIKNEAFQGHVRGRLEAHDNVLGMDTRQLSGEKSAASLPPPPPASGALVPTAFEQRQWFLTYLDKPRRAVTFAELKRSYQTKVLNENSLVWTAGMKAPRRILDVSGLLEALL